MIGTSRTEYVFIRICIALLRLVTPLCFLYSVLFFVLPRHKYLLAPYYPAAECLFYLLVYLPRRRHLQKSAVHPPLQSRAERERLFDLCQATIPDKDEYISLWFLGAHAADLQRRNVEDWLLWAVFSTDCIDLADHEWREEMDGYVARVETLLGRKLEPGRNENVRSIRLTLDEVRMLHRPLLWYMIVAFVEQITWIGLLRAGFRHYATTRWFTVFPPRPQTIFSRRSSEHLSYWLRPHQSKTKSPIVFIHGIGIGLWPYVPFLRELVMQEPDVGIILIELLPVSFRITAPIPTRETLCAQITAILAAHSFTDVCLVTHSYGSIVAAHLLHLRATTISSLVLIDPVALLLHLPATAYNFVYRAPRAANERQLHFFASTDPGVAHTLSRRFFWGQNTLWRHDLAGRRSGVVLSRRDQIMPASDVWRYATGTEVPFGDGPHAASGEGVDALYFPGLDHAQVFESKGTRAPVLELVRRYVRPAM